MKILTINAGSSSLKAQYFVDLHPIATILMEKIAQNSGTTHIISDGDKESIDTPLPNHHEALMVLFGILRSRGILESIDTLDGIVHRVVHGGSLFCEPTLITGGVLESIRSLIPLAPLHNPANLEGMEVIHHHYPHIQQVAVFDTAFHQSMPPHAFTYPIPYELTTTHHIRRYGFHGSSHAYLAKEASRLLNTPLSSLNLITLHLGNGASITAIEGGKSVDTSMGFTPLEGLMMGTRSGDIDPAIIFHLSRTHGMSIDEIDTLLNKKSGLLGVAGSSDMRDILSGVAQGDPQCTLAFDIAIYRIIKYIGAYFVVLGRVDGIVFSGGIGENAPLVRERIATLLAQPLGVALDPTQNAIRSSIPRPIHHPTSRIALLLIPTNEELEMAREAQKILKIFSELES